MRELPEIPIQWFGAAVSAQLAISGERHKQLRQRKDIAPNPVHVTLLIDTGASCSWIRPAYIKQLGLTQPRSWFPVETVDGHEQDIPAYEVCLILGVDGTLNARRFETLIGCRNFENTPHDGLLGRDILQHLQLGWNSPAGYVRVGYV